MNTFTGKLFESALPVAILALVALPILTKIVDGMNQLTGAIG